MFGNDENVNYILNYSKMLVDQMNVGKNIPSELKVIQYLVFAGFIAQYGFENIELIHKTFKTSNFVYTKEPFEKIVKTMPHLKGLPKDVATIGSFVSLQTSIDSFGRYHINRTVYVMDNNPFEAADLFLEKVVHEINHIINSLNNAIVIYKGNKAIRTGLRVSSLYSNDEFGRILDEDINVLQTAEIMEKIIEFSKYEVEDREIRRALKKLKRCSGKREGYGYETTVPIMKDLYANPKFKNLVVGSRLSGLVKPVRLDFDSKVGEGCYYQFCDLLDEIDKDPSMFWLKGAEEAKARQFIKKYNASR